MARSYLTVVRTRAVLPVDELKRRIDAARTLRGLRQIDLAALVESDGHGKHDIGRLERGDLPLTRALRRSLADHLRVPETWFTDDELDLTVTGGSEDRLAEEIRANREMLAQGQEERRAILRLLQTQQELLEAQTRILERMEAVAAGLPTDENLRALNEAARRLEAIDRAS